MEDALGPYAAPPGYDEAIGPDGIRPAYRQAFGFFSRMSAREFGRRRALTDLAFRNQGITFTVYDDDRGTERAFPFDPVPRIITAPEWSHVESGLRQRVRALNAFLGDVYGDQEILRDGVVPANLVLDNPNYRPMMRGVVPPHGVWTHIVGTDLIRDHNGTFRVLEDNLRNPSGVSYMLVNRDVTARSFPGLLRTHGVRPIRHYTIDLLATLSSMSPRDVDDPTVVLLTPGQFNSAYYEHSYLAQQMGIELVEGRDLFVDEGRVWMRTTHGRQVVDVVYRRIDDAFLDPRAFREDSMLGVPGLMEVVRAGRVGLANAVGTGVADDKAIYAYVPAMIDYYLGEQPILANVETYLGADPDGLDLMMRETERLVIKEVGGAGGYGMLIGSQADEEERDAFLQVVAADPGNYIAQPIVQLSSHPTFYPDTHAFEPCHVDLRPFALVGEDIRIVPGGLTRVALERGSLIVNSSRGGGSKDTWVLAESGPGAGVSAGDDATHGSNDAGQVQRQSSSDTADAGPGGDQ